MIDFGLGKVQEQSVKVQTAEPAMRAGAERAARAGQASRRNEGEAASPDSIAQAGALSARQIQEVVDKANEAVKHLDGRIRYLVDSKTRQVQIQVMDPSGETVLREIPPKELVELRERLKEAAGAILDAEA